MKSSSSPHRRTVCIVLATLTIIAGIVLREVHLGLPFWLVKYGGSALWAMMVYWIVGAFMPAWESSRLGIDAFLVGTIVELFKLYHSPMLDDFRRTLAGALLIGRYFSWLDIATYGLAIALITSLDAGLVRRGRG